MAADIATLDIRVQTSSLDDAGKKLDSVTKNAGETEKATDRLQKSFDGLKGVIFGVVGALGGLKLTQYIQEAVLLAARYETLGVVMNTAGRNAGYNAQQMDKFERSLRSQGIAMVEARQTLSMLAAAQMDLEKSGALARAAQDLAVVGGINSSEAFERLVRGIRSGEIEVLRTIGLNINFEQSYKKAAAQLGKNADQLTSHEKLIIRQNAALEEAAKFMGIYEASMSTAGKQLSSMERYLQDFKTLIGELGLNTLGVAVFGANDAFKKMNEELTRMRDAGELAVMSRTIGENIRAAAGAAMDAAVAFGMWYAAVRGMMVLNAVNAAITAATANAAGLAGALVQGSLVASQFGKAMLAAVGGPWVLGLSVAAFGIYKLATHQSEAEKVARSHTSALKDVDKALAGAAGSAAAFAEAVKDASKSQLELAKIDLERKLDGIRASSKALGVDLQQAFGREGLQGMMDFSGADLESRNLAEKFGFSQIVDDLNSGRLSAMDAAVAFEKLRRDMEQSGTATGAFTGFLADAADKLRLMAGNDVELNKLAQSLDRVSEAMRNMSSAAKQGGADVGEVIAKAAEYVKNLPKVKQEADTKTYTTIKADLEAVIKEGGDKAKEARALLANVEAAHKANQEGFAKKLASGSKDAESKARDLASALRDINEILADMTGDEKAVRLAKWGDTMAKLTKGLNGDKAGLARLAEADKSMRAAIDSGFESPQDMRNKRKSFDDDYDKAVLGDTGYAMQQVWKKGAEARALGIPEEKVARYELEAISKLMKDHTEKDLDTQREFNREMLELSGRVTEAKISDIERQSEVWAKAGIDAARIEEWKAEKILQASQDWHSGAVRALRSYRNTAADMGKQVEEALTRSFQSLEDVIVNFTMTGKLSFRDMVNSILSDMARMAAKQMTSNLLGMVLSSAGSALGGSMTQAWAGVTGQAYDPALQSIVSRVPLHHAGGMAGESSMWRDVPVSMFSGASRYHTGGMPGLASDEIPAILQRGERVQDRAEVAAMGNSSGRIVEAIEGLAGKLGGGTRIVNVTDSTLVHEAMASSGGEKVMLNFIKANRGTIKQVLNVRG